MGLRDLKRRLTATVDELDAERLLGRYQGLGLTPIAEARMREPVRLAGEVARLRMVPRSDAPSLEVTLSDGTGEAVAVFLGRRSLGGVTHGRGMVITGVAHLERGRRVILNPSYTLLADG